MSNGISIITKDKTMKEQTIEEQVASTILQEKKIIKVGGFSFEVAPPTLATLILASKIISKIPIRDFNKEKIVEGVFVNAEDCKAFSELASVLIIGAKNLKQVSRFNPLGYFYRRKQRKLAKWILNELSLKELKDLIEKIIEEMGVEHFFALSTFLSGVNLLKKTREVETTKN